MIAEALPGVTRRAAIAAVIIVLHIGALLILLATRSSAPAIPKPVMITVEAIPVATPHVTEPEAPLDAGLAMPVIEIEATATVHAPQCDLQGQLASNLQADPTVRAALEAVAATPEHAIMAWNGSWVARPEVVPLRQAVEHGLKAARADCLAETLTGPRLVFVPVAETTVSVAFGSGSWTWNNLLSKE